MAKDKSGKIVAYTPAGQKWMDGSVGADLPMTRLSELFNANHFIVSQVNPHVAPFLLHTEVAGRSGFTSAFMYLFKSEIKHRVTQMSELGLIPSVFQSIPPIVTQQYHGDITIVPEINLKDYKNLFSNPTQTFIEECIIKGRLSTWPKIVQIKQQCAIEFALEQCYEKLREQFVGSHSPRFARRLKQSESLSIATSPFKTSLDETSEAHGHYQPAPVPLPTPPAIPFPKPTAAPSAELSYQPPRTMNLTSLVTTLTQNTDVRQPASTIHPEESLEKDESNGTDQEEALQLLRRRGPSLLQYGAEPGVHFDNVGTSTDRASTRLAKKIGGADDEL